VTNEDTYPTVERYLNLALKGLVIRWAETSMNGLHLWVLFTCEILGILGKERRVVESLLGEMKRVIAQPKGSHISGNQAITL
jgi:hypothetical protein